MKTTLFIAILLIALGCSGRKEGEVTGRSNNHIIINGKEYYFLRVIPADGERGVWLLIPKDADVKLPQMTSYRYSKSCGKNCVRYYSQTAIVI